MNEIENNMHKYRRDEKKMRKKKKTIQEEVQTKQIKKNKTSISSAKIMNNLWIFDAGE